MYWGRKSIMVILLFHFEGGGGRSVFLTIGIAEYGYNSYLILSRLGAAPSA